MPGERLDAAEIELAMEGWSEKLRAWGLAARDLVLDVAPALDETIAFHALCYYRGGIPYGVIGGNVCLIAEKRGRLQLSFLHGAFLDDPTGLLTGSAKSKRAFEVRDAGDLANPALVGLIRAAARCDPAR